jgi:hypothetical protein
VKASSNCSIAKQDSDVQKLNAKLLVTGLLAGMTAALLILGALRQPLFSIPLISASAVPVLIAGLSWGNVAAITSVAAACLASAVLSLLFGIDLSFVLMALFLTAIPAWLSHLANLARPASELGGPGHLMAWYPLSDILLHLCGLVTLAVIAAGLLIGYGPGLVAQTVDLYISVLKDQQPAVAVDADAIEKTKTFMLYALPFAWGMMWVLMMLVAYYIATRIVVASGRSLRPREDMPSALRMNRNAIFVFLAGIVTCFFGGSVALIGLTVAGAFGMGFLASGFASLHYRTRGKDWRLPVLIIVYLTSLLVTLPLFVILVLGLYDTRKAIALTPNKNSDTSKQTDTKI